MGDYTPTTAEVRGLYTVTMFRENQPHLRQSLDEHRADFDRWLKRVKAEAIRETATLTTRRGQGFVYVKDILEYSRRVGRGKG